MESRVNKGVGVGETGVTSGHLPSHFLLVGGRREAAAAGLGLLAEPLGQKGSGCCFYPSARGECRRGCTSVSMTTQEGLEGGRKGPCTPQPPPGLQTSLPGAGAGSHTPHASPASALSLLCPWPTAQLPWQQQRPQEAGQGPNPSIPTFKQGPGQETLLDGTQCLRPSAH